MPIINLGQKGKATFNVVKVGKPKGLNIAGCEPITIYDCNYITPVLANNTGNDLENDRSSFLGMFQDWTTSAIFVIQKKTGTTFIDKGTVNDNSYGEWFPQNSFKKKPKYAGFIANWSLILAAWGEGIYRVKITEFNPLNLSGKENFSMEFCLKQFSCFNWENTVRLEWYSNYEIGNINDDKDILDFADINWFNQLRIPNSIFGYPKSSYETQENQHTNGEFEPVTDVQTELYQLTIGLSPAYIHDIIKTYALMSSKLSITDYSSNNPQGIYYKDVKKKSGFEPRWGKQRKCAPVTIELEPRFNNLETFRR